jgi:ferric-dicitrate binding protein FerR (iron transport regulator)
VTGTKFNIRSWADHPTKETTLTVTEGTVQFYADENPSESISLRAGEVSQWNATLKKPKEAQDTSPDAQLAWREGRFVFQETPLIAILNDLERSFDIHIYLEVEGIEMDPLTAYYNRSASIETILEDICTVKGLRYTKTTDGYRIYN